MDPLTPKGTALLNRSKYHLNCFPSPYGQKIPGQYWTKDYGLQSRFPSDQEVEKWFKGYDRCNVSLVCGISSGKDGLSVIDYESEEIYRKVNPDYKELESKTRVEATPHNGRKVYFDSPWCQTQIVLPGQIEILGDGRCCLGYPSVLEHHFCNGCGKTGSDSYKVLGTFDIFKTKENVAQLLRIKLKELGFKPQLTNSPKLKDILNGVPEGIRHNSALRVVSHLLHCCESKDSDSVWFLLQQWNKLCNPPLPERELAEVLLSGLKYQEKPKKSLWGMKA